MNVFLAAGTDTAWTVISMHSLCVRRYFHRLFNFFSPVQLFAVAQRSSARQAALCLINEMPQRYTHMQTDPSTSHYTVHLKLIFFSEFENAGVRNTALLTLNFPFYFLVTFLSLFYHMEHKIVSKPLQLFLH